jgi:hypothetical protein
MIYEYALSGLFLHFESFIRAHVTEDGGRKIRWEPLALTRVCKQTHQDTKHLIFSYNTVRFAARPYRVPERCLCGMHYESPGAHFLSLLNYDQLNAVTSLHVIVYYHTCSHSVRRVDPYTMALLRTVVGFEGLKVVVLELRDVPWGYSRWKAEFAGEMRRVLIRAADEGKDLKVKFVEGKKDDD